MRNPTFPRTTLQAGVITIALTRSRYALQLVLQVTGNGHLFYTVDSFAG